jgi:hypothetical protein
MGEAVARLPHAGWILLRTVRDRLKTREETLESPFESFRDGPDRFEAPVHRLRGELEPKGELFAPPELDPEAVREGVEVLRGGVDGCRVGVEGFEIRSEGVGRGFPRRERLNPPRE